MKKNYSWLLFVAYFLIFVILGVIFYFRYLDQFLLPGAEPPKVEVVSQNQIYYSLSDGLYQTNPDYNATGALIEATKKLVSSGDIGSVDVVAEKYLAFSALNQAGHSEVFKTDFSGENLEAVGNVTKIADFSDFSKPHFDPKANQLAFIASSDSKDAIFSLDLGSGSLNNLTPAIVAKISDFSWDTTGEKIIFCTKNPGNNLCQALMVSTGKSLGTFSAQVSQIYWNKSAIIYFLGSSSGTTNIFSLSDLSATPVALTNIASPKSIGNFSLSDGAEAVTYEVREGETRDVYSSQINGSNSIQLTQDKKSFSPLISPNGKLVAFLRAGDGIYLIGVDKLNEKKLLNLTDPNIGLQLWR